MTVGTKKIALIELAPQFIFSFFGPASALLCDLKVFFFRVPVVKLKYGAVFLVATSLAFTALVHNGPEFGL